MKGYICDKSGYTNMAAPTFLPSSAELSADKDTAKQN